MTLADALWVDSAVVALSAAVVLSRPHVSFMHPGVIYLFLHVYLITMRGWAVERGAATFFNVPVSTFPKVVLMADLALVVAVFAWAAVGAGGRVHASSPYRTALVPPDVVHKVALVSVPLGVLSLVTTGFLPGFGVSDTVVTTSYQTVAILWPALAGVAWVYVHGFRWFVMAPLSAYLVIMAMQGHSRFRFAIPVIMLLLVYLHRKGMRWPPARLWIPLLVLAVVFVPLKEIGMQIRAGDASWDGLVAVITDSTGEASKGTNTEQALLDQFAISVMIADQNEVTFLGRPYIALLSLPVPRPIWPNKPGLASHLQELQTDRYPLADVGAITTLPGDLYLNFRWFGVLIGIFLLATASGRLYLIARACPRKSAYMFAYILLAGILVQVARDGLTSIVMFTLVNATPWLAIWFLSVRREISRTRYEASVMRSAF